MSHTNAPIGAPPPIWLLRLAGTSGVLAVVALAALVWSRWGMVATVLQDVMKYCF